MNDRERSELIKEESEHRSKKVEDTVEFLLRQHGKDLSRQK